MRTSISRVFGRTSALVVDHGQTRCASFQQTRQVGRKKGAIGIWSKERLQTDDQFPLSKTLSAAINPLKEARVPKPAGRKQGIPDTPAMHVRSQIVSPDLCDDVIKYIGPTLDKHKGCDVIDINPGAGLWSQKLHDYLNPRSHVLLEPRYDKFKQFLEPLLTAPGSKYTLIEKDPCALETYREMVSEGVFPHQVVRSPQDPKAQEANNTVLVTGSLVWDPRLPGLGFDSMAKQLFNHFASAAGSNDIFHAFGLVRTLFWVQHEDFSPVIADSISSLHKANRYLELTHNMTLVVNGERSERGVGRASSGREPQYELESLIRTLKRARANGFEIPPHRRSGTYNYAEEIERLTKGTGIMRVEAMQEFLRKQHAAGNPTTGLLQKSYIDHYNDGLSLTEKYPDVALDSIVGTGKALKTLIGAHPGYNEIQAFMKKRHLLKAGLRMKTIIEACADIAEKMYNLEVKALGMKDGAKRDALIKEIEGLDQEWHQGIANITPNFQPSAPNEVDERLSMRTPPSPRIQWDQRPFEPLTMKSNEVWPQNRLSLISTEPIPRPYKEDIPDYTEWVQDFVFSLYNIPSEPIGRALDRMQHGMSDIIKHCPSLKDPKKGGRLMMNHFRVRMLTVEMLEELVTAYKNWPFKAPGSDHPNYFRHKGNLGQYSSRGN
ncbi:hypothetical protein NX059_003193 [Plenodomus lindquistii]|nr:hypothetical protein NX059_003193 [Plenodomus lindquistii]